MRIETYGVGGHDPSKPNNNIIEVREIPDPDEPNMTRTERSSSKSHRASLGLASSALVLAAADLAVRLLH